MIRTAQFLITATAVLLYPQPKDAVGAIQSAALAFTTGAERAFHFVSGDLPCEVIAEVTGSFILQYDEATGAATLNSLQAFLTSAQTAMGGNPFEYPAGHYCQEARDSFEGATLSSVMAGLSSGVQGSRTGPSEFKFGPALSENGEFLWEFVLSTNPQASRLSGSSVFYGDDGPSYFLNAPVVLVPEPVTCQLLAVASVALLLGTRRDLPSGRARARRPY